MKKVALHLFVFALLLFAQQALASHGSIEVFNPFGRYTVTVNQAVYPNRIGTFTMDGLVPGAYRVQVIKEAPNRRAAVAYGHVPNTIVYDAWIHLKPYELFSLTLERNGLVRTHSVLNTPPVVIAPAPVPVCHDPLPGYYGGYVAPVAYGMAPDQFASLKQVVIRSSFDSTKRELLQGALASNRLTSQQLYELLTLLDFESSRLEIAKLGYAKVVDKENFYAVYNAFSFDSSVRELNRWIVG